MSTRAPASAKQWSLKRGQRGLSALSILFEAAAILTWYALVLVGERRLAAATASRRLVETRAAEAAERGAKGGCTFLRPPHEDERDATLGVEGAPVPPAAARMARSLDSLGMKGAAPLSLYERELRRAVATAQEDLPPEEGGGEATFRATRIVPCWEPPVDRPETSIGDYRKAIFDRHIRGYR